MAKNDDLSDAEFVVKYRTSIESKLNQITNSKKSDRHKFEDKLNLLGNRVDLDEYKIARRFWRIASEQVYPNPPKLNRDELLSNYKLLTQILDKLLEEDKLKRQQPFVNEEQEKRKERRQSPPQETSPKKQAKTEEQTKAQSNYQQTSKSPQSTRHSINPKVYKTLMIAVFVFIFGSTALSIFVPYIKHKLWEMMKGGGTSTLIQNTPNQNGTDKIVDADGNIYASVQIGNQLWMKQNLRTTHFRDGSPIPASGAVAYNQNTSNDAVYGKLYTWRVATDPRSVCPAGWHLPSERECRVLADFLGGSSIAGGKMKAAELWSAENVPGDNSSGFTGLPGGYLNTAMGFSDLGKYGKWWTSSPSTQDRAIYYGLDFDNNELQVLTNGIENSFSIRCIKDQ